MTFSCDVDNDVKGEHTISFMLPPHVDVDITFPGMIGSIEIRNFGKIGTRIFGERVPVQASNAQYNCLFLVNIIPATRYW